jgi:hypothetical protein
MEDTRAGQEDAMGDAGDGGTVLTRDEVTVLVWLLDLAAEESSLPVDAGDIWARLRERLTQRPAPQVTART